MQRCSDLIFRALSAHTFVPLKRLGIFFFFYGATIGPRKKATGSGILVVWIGLFGLSVSRSRNVFHS